MKILIDLQSCQSPSHMRGIGRYSLDLALEMVVIGRDKHDFHILLNSYLSDTTLYLRSLFEPLIGGGNIHLFGGVPGVSGFTNNVELMRCAELVREYKIKLINPDFIHISSFFEGFDNNSIVSIPENSNIPTAVTLYDLIPLVNEKEYLKSSLHKAWYNKKVKELRRADILFSISESTKKESLEYLKVSPDKVVNISSAVSNKFLSSKLTEADSKNILNNLNIYSKYILYTANLDKRKNITGLFEAYSLLDADLRAAYKLVIVSYIDDERKAVLEAKAAQVGILQDEFIITGHVTDKQLIALYTNCSLFVFPSLHEGFGLPCLEAMVCGAPVIGSNTTSIPEVIGLKSALFDPQDSQEIASLITKSLVDDEYHQLLLDNSKQRVKVFSWSTTANTLLQNIESFNRPKKENISKEKSYKQCIDSVSPASLILGENELTDIANSIDISMPREKPELLVDITALAESDAKTGIQRVVKSIIEQWSELPFSHQIRLVYLASDGHYYYAFEYESKYAQFHGRDKGYVLPSAGDIFVGLDLVAHAAACTGEIYKKWREMGVFICIVVYDILPITMPQFFHSGIKNAFPIWGKMIIERADLLLCISESVANEVKQYIASSSVERLLPYSVDYFHLGADFAVSKGAEEEIDEPELVDVNLSKTFLMVGTIEPRKGHQQVIDAFESLIDSGYTLLIVGRVGWNTEVLIKKLEYSNVNASNIRWLSDCSDETLQYLYGNCCALIAASYGEGFGLPLIEAAQYQIPIIARALPVFREVAGEYAYYFDDNNDSKTVIDAINSWLVLYENDNHPKSCGMPWLTWKESAKEFQSKLMSQPTNYGIAEAKKKLFLDISSLIHFDHATGIQRVVRAICEVLLKKDLQNFDCEVVFSYPGDDKFYYPTILNENFCIPHENEINNNIVDFREGDILVFLDLHPENGVSKKQLIQDLKLKNIRTYFVVYDLLPISHPQYFVLELVSEFTQWLESVISSDGALCISKDVSNKLTQWITQNNKKTSSDFKNEYFHLGANLDGTAPSVGIPSYAPYLKTVCASMQTFLMVGTVEPRKGHGLVLDAFEQLWESGVDVALIIVGKAGWCNDKTLQRLKQNKELNKRLFWLEGISDEYLDIIYKEVSCLLAASEGEGFGLPLIEAAKHQVPIIARDIPVFREVAGDYAYYFNAKNDPSYLYAAIKEWLEMFEQSMHPKSSDMLWLTWEKSGQQLLSCLDIN